MWSDRDYGDENDYAGLLEEEEDFVIDPEYLLDDDDEDFEYEPAWYEEEFEEEE